MELEDTIFTNKEDLVRTSIERMHIQGIRFPFVKRCRKSTVVVLSLYCRVLSNLLLQRGLHVIVLTKQGNYYVSYDVQGLHT